MTEKTKIVMSIKGGVIQRVLSNVPFDCIVLDQDTDGGRANTFKIDNTMCDVSQFAGEVDASKVTDIETQINDARLKPVTRKVQDLVLGDLVDLASCPYLKKHPTAEFQFAEVAHVKRETDTCVVIGYEGIDHIGYPVDTELQVMTA